MDSIRFDCKFYLGDRPCEWGGRCEGCEHYVPMGTRVLVVKLAAAGDVLRATSILPPLKARYPESHVTWICDQSALPLVRGNPFLDRAMPFGFEAWLTLSAQRFDLVINLDKEPRAAAFAASVPAEKRLGFGLSDFGTIEPLTDGARRDLKLGLSNEVKFHENTLTYPEIFCEIAELQYGKEPYCLVLPDASIRYAESFIAEIGAREPLVGLNVGAGPVFANKAWAPEGFAELARRIDRELGGTALVMYGPDDRERAAKTIELSAGAAVDAGTHALLDFAAIVGSLDALVTGDTMALHIGVALAVPVIAIFGPTVPQEIDLYGRGRKIVASIECAPCYLRSCDRSPSCMDAVGIDEVFAAVREAVSE